MKRENILVILCNEIRILTQNKDAILDVNTELKNIGFDSLKFIKLLIHLEEVFKIEFEDYELTINRFERIGNIVQRIIELS